MNGWRPDVGPGLDAAIERLRTGALEVVGRLPWSSNLTFLVTVGSDGPGAAEALSAVYKPATGERSLWDFPDGLYRREVAAYELSEALGWGLVPPTLERDGPYGPGSLQLFVDADYEQHYFTLFDERGHDTALRTICVFDIVANNADRKSGHVLSGPDDRLWAIDHGLCFHRQPKLRTVIWDYADDDVPPGLLGDLVRLSSELPGRLRRLLSGQEQEALADRIETLVRRGTFPEPIGDRPPYPWPLV
ncbi:MAG: SCO1664 family protein [Acidimicrobiales bacterium]